MANLKEIRDRITSVKSTQQITRAMTMVSAAKLRRYQDRITRMRPYSEKLQEILYNIAGSIDPSSLSNPFYEKREVKKSLIVTFTGDKGLCGSFNNQAIKQTTNLIKEKFPDYKSENNVEILSMGKKGTEFFKKHDYPVWRGYTEFLTQADYDAAYALSTELLDHFANGSFDQVYLVYNKFKNPIVYIPTIEKWLPVDTDLEEAQPEEAKDDSAKYTTHTSYIYQPSREEIMDTLIPKSLKVTFYRVMLDSLAAEFGSRMTAMDQATDNAEDLIRELRITFNKERQASITKEIMEIVSGAQALETS